MSSIGLGAGLCLALCATAAGQSFENRDALLNKSFQIRRTDHAPVIDGTIDEDAWNAAAVVSDFYQREPVEYAEPSEVTNFLVMYDNDNLYIGMRIFDSEPDKILANVLRQGDRFNTGDWAGVVLDPFNNKRSGYWFGINPNSVRLDGIYQNPTEQLWDWDGIFYGKGSLTEQGWEGEMAIPFKTLSFDPENDTWGMNFARSVRRRDETVNWVSLNREWGPSSSGTAVGFEGMEQGLGLDIVPSVSVNQRREFVPAHSDSSLEPSLDVFYKLTSSLNASLTLNTDFSATEVDDRQVNLTRFNLFFPEKRDFFLRDFDIFQFGRISESATTNTQNTAASRAAKESGSPFFSRRIGIDEFGAPVDLEVGGKLSGRIGGWDVGALAIRQDASADLDAKTLTAGRFVKEIFDGGTIGGIFTNGDPQSNDDNTVTGADFQYLNTRLASGRTFQAEAWFQQSDTDGLVGDDSAFGLGARMPNRTGWRWGFGLKEIDRNFAPAQGFVDRSGVRDHTLELGYTKRRRDAWIREIGTIIDAQKVDELGGGLQSQVIKFRLVEMGTRTRDSLNAFYNASKEVLHEAFEISPGITIPVGEYSFDDYGFSFETGNHRPLSGSFTYQNGDFYEGTKLGLEASMLWRPSMHFRTQLRYAYNEIELPQGNFETRLLRLSADVIFSSTLAWTNLIQYDNVTEEAGISSRLHWIPQAGREGFIVLNHNLQDYDRDNSFKSQLSDFALKFSYTFRY